MHPSPCHAERAAVFQRVLEDLRRARAQSRVLAAAVDAPEPPWASLVQTRSHCERLHSGLAESEPVMGQALSGKVENLLCRLEEALFEMTLCSLLGPGDESGRGALGRARRALELDTAHLERAIRADMASQMMLSGIASA